MKLLFDQNISPSLVGRLRDLFPDSAHVSAIGLGEAIDEEVWRYARANGFVIVTKDTDFVDLSTLMGPPPAVIWLRMGNCTTAGIEQRLRASSGVIAQLEGPANLGVVAIT